MVENFCFKFSCLETKTVDGKLIVKNLKLWRNEIEFLKALLETLNASKNVKNIADMLQLLDFAEGMNSLDQLLQAINETSNNVIGIKKLKETASVLKENKKIYLSNEMRMIVKSYMKPVSIISKIVSGKLVLEITGKHMTMSEVLPDVEPFLSTISEIHFIGAEVIHIDKNLLPQTWNSKTIDMKAKIINVHGISVWDLSGKDGSDSEEKDRHGKNGGLIFISAEELINGSQLIIRLNGGNGRNGRDAGQITDGIDGKDVSQTTIEKITNEVWDDCNNDGGIYKKTQDGFSCEYLCRFANHKTRTLTVCHGGDRIPPVFQSKITCGNAGFAGMAIITVMRSDSKVNIINNEGTDGQIPNTVFKTKSGSKGQDRATLNVSKIPGFKTYISGYNERFEIGYYTEGCESFVWNHPLGYYNGLVRSFSHY